MKELTINEMQSINAGKTYYCPFGCNKKGGFWSVYGHCLSTKCFKKDKTLGTLWNAGVGCLDAGLQMLLCGAINKAPKGKHFR